MIDDFRIPRIPNIKTSKFLVDVVDISHHCGCSVVVSRGCRGRVVISGSFEDISQDFQLELQRKQTVEEDDAQDTACCGLGKLLMVK